MKKSRILMFLGALLPLLLFVFPLWKITLEAPQYPTPLGMYIYIDDFADANPHDIKNINLMNHYVGMKYIPDAIPEFQIFPIGILVSVLIGLLVAWKAPSRWYLFWFLLMIAVSTAGLIDFYLWEYEYGHDLDPKAIMKFTNPDGSVMGFQPPFFGSKDILNFRAHSYPQLGAYSLGLGILLSLVAYVVGRKEAKTPVES
ncbi:hypothetical protein OZ410_13435 [Robiginitalea sp. M366]|uniref:hypothetical protein n=1 Tax=Robiginitalea aestuariiviva TaxID=3036903 RepID=UPI00240D3D91|nr:hypothetical protein [Robiginitalea aestuariiviva]MDG1573326.1 hypothetical protein [Robiginitalea aestuariiviva]